MGIIRISNVDPWESLVGRVSGEGQREGSEWRICMEDQWEAFIGIVSKDDRWESLGLVTRISGKDQWGGSVR